MSKEIATTFIQESHRDNEIQQKVVEISPIATASDFVNLAATFGYKFSEEDLVEAAKAEIESQTSPASEIADVELESVAGGQLNSATCAKQMTNACFRNL